MDPNVFANVEVELVDFPTGLNDSGIIAHSPTIKVPGMMYRRVVLRHIGDSYVVHIQAWHKVGLDEPCEFHHGNYFDFRNYDSDIAAFRAANKAFRKRSEALVNEI